MDASLDHGGLMDRVYRHQRHFYDATRRYYLPGRTRLVEELGVPRGGTVLEIGCGTGRNLLHAATLYPHARLYGVDISGQMLATALAGVARRSLAGRVTLAEADAARLDPRTTFGVERFDRVFFSYSISMIPPWREALARAVSVLAPGGRLAIVDFGQLEAASPVTKSLVFRWLAWNHVTPRHDLEQELRSLARRIGGRSTLDASLRGYVWYATITAPSGTGREIR